MNPLAMTLSLYNGRIQDVGVREYVPYNDLLKSLSEFAAQESEG